MAAMAAMAGKLKTHLCSSFWVVNPSVSLISPSQKLGYNQLFSCVSKLTDYGHYH